MSLSGHLVVDYQMLRLSLKAHPIAFLRASMARKGLVRAADPGGIANNRRPKLAGLVLVGQRPGSVKGVCFITIGDETGVANLVVWLNVLAAFRKVIMTARLMQATGRLQRDPATGLTHIVVKSLQDRSEVLLHLSDRSLVPPLFARTW